MPVQQKKSRRHVAVTPKPAEDQAAKLTTQLDISMGQFASNLATARYLWRKFPSLVEATDFPASLLKAFKRQEPESEPDTIGGHEELLVEHGILTVEDTESRTKSIEALRAAAKQVARDQRNELVATFFNPEMSASEKAELAVLQRILWDDRGSMTPAENFVSSLVYLHGCDPLTKEIVHQWLETFDGDWDDAVNISKRFYRDHYDLVTDEADTKEAA